MGYVGEVCGKRLCESVGEGRGKSMWALFVKCVGKVCG